MGGLGNDIPGKSAQRSFLNKARLCQPIATLLQGQQDALEWKLE